ncbi:unnamed protein product [Caenorhabditis brenneri]
MTPNVHRQQQNVSIPKELFGSQTGSTGDQTSVIKPTLEEIENAVNYLMSLHHQKQKERDNSFWTKCISCFGLQRKPLKANHIDQILNSLKRGVIPMELTLIVSIQRWEKKRTLTGNSEKPSSSSQNAHSNTKQKIETTYAQKTKEQFHATINSVNGKLSPIAEEENNAEKSETGSEVIDAPTSISISTSMNTNEKQGISRSILQNKRYMMPNLSTDDFNFKEISLINKSCVLQFVILTILFAGIFLYAFHF